MAFSTLIYYDFTIHKLFVYRIYYFLFILSNLVRYTILSLSYLPDRPMVRFRSVSKAVVADDSDLSVGRAGGGNGNGPTVEVVVKSQHSRSGNSLQRAR